MNDAKKALDASQLKDDIQRVKEHRDQVAFARLFDHFVPLIRAFSLASYPGAALLADEVAQEVMIKVWTKSHTYRPEVAAVSTWVFTLARNARIDYLRKNSRHVSEIDPEFLWASIIDESADPFSAAVQKRNAEQVNIGLNEISIEQKQVLCKVYMEGKTHQEISADINLPLGTVKSRLRLALKKLSVVMKRV